MRTLQLSLVGTVILVLLGGLGGAVVAQEEELSGNGDLHRRPEDLGRWR